MSARGTSTTFKNVRTCKKQYIHYSKTIEVIACFAYFGRNRVQEQLLPTTLYRERQIFERGWYSEIYRHRTQG